MNDVPLKFSEIYSGMTLWDNEWQRTQKVLRVYLWEDMIANNPNRYFKRKPKNNVNPTEVVCWNCDGQKVNKHPATGLSVICVICHGEGVCKV